MQRWCKKIAGRLGKKEKIEGDRGVLWISHPWVHIGSTKMAEEQDSGEIGKEEDRGNRAELWILHPRVYTALWKFSWPHAKLPTVGLEKKKFRETTLQNPKNFFN